MSLTPFIAASTFDEVADQDISALCAYAKHIWTERDLHQNNERSQSCVMYRVRCRPANMMDA